MGHHEHGGLHLTLVVGLTQDASGNNLVSSVTDPTGTHVTSYTYDTSNASPLLANDMLTITKPNGQAGGPDAGADTVIAYDNDGNELWTTTGVYEPGSNTAAYSQTTYQLFNGNSITLNGNSITCAATPPSPTLPCATINADGVVTQLAYYTTQDGNGDFPGDLKSTSTPDGNAGNEQAKTTYAYDADGEQTSVTSPDGNLPGAIAGNYTTVTAYNGDAQKTSVTQADGTGATVASRQTVYGYDGDGNQITVKDPRSNTTTTTFNADDQPTLVTDPDSN